VKKWSQLPDDVFAEGRDLAVMQRLKFKREQQAAMEKMQEIAASMVSQHAPGMARPNVYVRSQAAAAAAAAAAAQASTAASQQQASPSPNSTGNIGGIPGFSTAPTGMAPQTRAVVPALPGLGAIASIPGFSAMPARPAAPAAPAPAPVPAPASVPVAASAAARRPVPVPPASASQINITEGMASSSLAGMKRKLEDLEAASESGGLAAHAAKKLRTSMAVNIAHQQQAQAQAPAPTQTAAAPSFIPAALATRPPAAAPAKKGFKVQLLNK
jgi:hypothetical protein